MNAKLFGTSGIRGVANTEVTSLLALQVGEALASQLDGGAVAVGRDTRLSGEMLEAALVAGVASCGGEARALGVIPTPVLAYLTREMEADAGVSISASHNPPEYNGLKVFDSTSMAYAEDGQRRIEEAIEGGSFGLVPWDETGTVEATDARWMYVDALVEGIDLERSWCVACDLFNGATCTVAPDALRALGCEAILINAQPDGRFPAGLPEPTPKSMGRLGQIVVAAGAEIGFGFDGDGDRMMAVDERGSPPNPDRVLAAYARHVVEGVGDGVVVTHIGASMCVEEAVAEAGGSVVRTAVGDVSVAGEIIHRGAVFGGEPVGAWIHPEVHLCPDGILSALKLMEALEEVGETLVEFVADIPEYSLVREKVVCPTRRKARAMEAISARHGDVFGGVRSASTVDGVRLELSDGWVLMRPSGTEAAIRITVEAREMQRANELMDRSRRLVTEAVVGEV